jgi:hypothetical protein
MRPPHDSASTTGQAACCTATGLAESTVAVGDLGNSYESTASISAWSVYRSEADGECEGIRSGLSTCQADHGGMRTATFDRLPGDETAVADTIVSG